MGLNDTTEQNSHDTGETSQFRNEKRSVGHEGEEGSLQPREGTDVGLFRQHGCHQTHRTTDEKRTQEHTQKCPECFEEDEGAERLVLVGGD